MTWRGHRCVSSAALHRTYAPGLGQSGASTRLGMRWDGTHLPEREVTLPVEKHKVDRWLSVDERSYS